MEGHHQVPAVAELGSPLPAGTVADSRSECCSANASGAGLADEAGGQTIGCVALFTANPLRGSAAGGWLPGGAVASVRPGIQGILRLAAPSHR